MSGIFGRLFGPRWQHRDPSVRRQAIDRLDAGQPRDRQRLEQLANDSDPDVRQAALARLEDPARLLALCDDQYSPELHAQLVALLTGQAGNVPLAERLTLVERVDDRDLLTRLALQGDNQELRLAALARLDDEPALIHQACENSIAAVRHAAAERVISEEGLAQLARQARRDKHVARLARDRLSRLREDASQAEAQRIERERILEALEQHAQHAWEPLYAGRYRHLMREWERLPDLATPEQEQRYQEACLRCRKVITDHEAQHQAIETADQQRNDAEAERQALVEALEESVASLRQGDSLTQQDIDSLLAHKRLQASRWQALSEQHVPSQELSQRYTQSLEAHERIRLAWERLEQQSDALREGIEQQDNARLRSVMDSIDWPSDLPPSPLLRRVKRQLSQQPVDPAGPQQAERFAKDLDELEKLLERGAFKQASRLHQSLRQRFDTLPADRRQPLQPRLKRLGARLAELRDWRGFVAGPKRNQLCLAIEDLAEDTTLPDAELDRRHRQLVKDWKNLGDAAAERELSSRFRAASDHIHERLAPWRKALDEERQRNLEAREGLCDQLEALLDNPDPGADPDALREIRDRSREQWRRFSPVPRDHAEQVGQRFGRIRHALQALIDQRAQEIATAKRALVEEARQLQYDKGTAAQRAEQAKALQRRWRELGRAPKGEEQALWREFRSLCDTLFAARESERDDRAQRARNHLDAMQALIERLDAWQPSSSHEAGLLEQAIAEADSLEPLPAGRRSEGMRRRWTGIVRARRDRLLRLALSEEIQRWQQLRPLLERHLDADAQRLEGHEAVSIEAMPGLDDDMLNAHEQRNASRQDPMTAEQVAETLGRLRVHLALLAGDRVERADEPLRLAIQVERLNESRERELSKAGELHDILCGILATGPVPPALWSREAGELDSHLAQLARLPTP
ncbi:uncharacterized protein DUF349 [Modicisalibacter xianhensis]|uniref:Uncharacterized protein DUF349 n=1 Tax=Modicisalibacter xianhensis TaxID=442341 RepID=A0A4R8FWN4_9GAMM|nr:DUF349 domain-containing protein [Halomonas xianhensis]TDX27907.1 uncharacterized protein DUF349 [Halomonas xianhensis]